MVNLNTVIILPQRAENAVLDTENNRSPSVVQSMEEVRRLDVASTNTPNMVVKPESRVIRSISFHFIWYALSIRPSLSTDASIS